MRTYIDYFHELPADVASQAIENTPGYLLAVKEESLKSALLGAFVWQKTPQGHKYWQEIYESLDQLL